MLVVRNQFLQALNGGPNQFTDFLAISESHEGGHCAHTHGTGDGIEFVDVDLQTKLT